MKRGFGRYAIASFSLPSFSRRGGLFDDNDDEEEEDGEEEAEEEEVEDDDKGSGSDSRACAATTDRMVTVALRSSPKRGCDGSPRSVPRATTTNEEEGKDSAPTPAPASAPAPALAFPGANKVTVTAMEGCIIGRTIASSSWLHERSGARGGEGSVVAVAPASTATTPPPTAAAAAEGDVHEAPPQATER